MRRVMIAGAVALAVVAGVLVWVVRGTDDSDAARDTAADFLAGWQLAEEQDVSAAAELTDDPEAAASLLESVHRNLSPGTSEAVLGEAQETDNGDRAFAYSAVYDLGEGLSDWQVDATLTLTDDGDDGWRVRWDPALVHPDLVEGQTLVRQQVAADRAPVLAADDSELAAVGTVWNVTIWPAMVEDAEALYEVLDDIDVGLDVETLAERVAEADEDQAVPVVTLRDAVYEEHRDALNAVPGLQFAEGSRPLAHAARSVIGGVDPDTGEGSSGLQARYDEQLAGTGELRVVIADRESGNAVATLAEAGGGEPGTPVRTTLDPDVQEAAEDALAGQDQDGSIAVVRPSTGEILALADHPDGHARSAEGRFAPGSGFKVVTAAALLEEGVRPGDQLGCAKYAQVDGQQFHNQNEFELGDDTTLHEAFIRSCNTAFIENRELLDGDQLQSAAAAFGIGGEWDAGMSVYSGDVPAPENDNELAAGLIGQGRVLSSPVGMAAVAATVAEGEFRQPVLVPDAVTSPYEPDAALSGDTLSDLRGMMRATVTEGTATVLSDLPGAAHAKTGTAEFAAGEDGELSTHAWLIGYLGEGDLAFAVLLEDGGSGGSHAGPVAVSLLEALG